MKLKKGIKHITITIGIFSILVISIGIVFMETGGNKYLTQEIKATTIDRIQNSPELPENFLNVYNIAYPNSLSGNYWGYVIEKLTNDTSKRKCPCRKVFHFIEKREINIALRYNAIAGSQIALEIEDYCSQTECLQYIMSKYDFMNGIIGIENASFKIYGQPLSKLTDMQIVELLLIMKNPAYYQNHPESHLFKTERNRIIEKLGTTKAKRHARGKSGYLQAHVPPTR